MIDDEDIKFLNTNLRHIIPYITSELLGIVPINNIMFLQSHIYTTIVLSDGDYSNLVRYLKTF